jgi:hypothetical protein
MVVCGEDSLGPVIMGYRMDETINEYLLLTMEIVVVY